MPGADDFANYPQHLKHGTSQPDVVYDRQPDRYALLDDDERPHVVEGEPPVDASCVAVYAQAGGGQELVPTGRVFVRFADGVDAESRRDTLAAGGYDITEVVWYAPNAAWLEATSGEVADALANVGAIEGLVDVMSVEPQLLAARTHRHDETGR